MDWRQQLKGLIFEITMELFLRDKRNAECTELFRHGGLRARMRFLQCAPYYQVFLGKSLEDIHKEMESFDWREVGTVYYEDLEDLSGLDEDDLEIMKLQGYKTRAELNAYYNVVSPVRSSQDTSWPDKETSNSKPSQPNRKDTPEQDTVETPDKSSLETKCRKFLTRFGTVRQGWLPKPLLRGPKESVKFSDDTELHTIHEDEEDEEDNEGEEDGEVGDTTTANVEDGLSLPESVIWNNILDLRSLQVKAQTTRDRNTKSEDASNDSDSIPGKDKEAVPISDDKPKSRVRYTWHDKARMVFWQAEALYMTMLAQDKIDRGLQEVTVILRQADWLEEFEALVASGRSGISDDY